MAKPKKEDKGLVDDNLLEKDLSPAAVKALTTHFDNTSAKITMHTTGLNSEEVDSIIQQNTLQADINKTLNDIMATITPGGRSDISDDGIDTILALSQIPMKNGNVGKKSVSLSEINKAKKQLAELKNGVLEANAKNLDSLMNLHKTKFMDSIATYNLIIRIIPKMRLALNTFATSILSPDDFTRDAVHVKITNTSLEKSDIKVLNERVESLFDKHNVNKNIKDDILQYLINGKLYYHVTSVNKQLVKMLNEEQHYTGEGFLRTIDNNYMEEALANALSESYKGDIRSSAREEFLESFCNSFNLNRNNPTELSEAAKRIDKFLKDEIIIADSSTLHNYGDSSSITEDLTVNYASAFFNRNSTVDGNSFSNNILDKKSSLHQDVDKEKVKYSDIKGDNVAIVKRISASNIIPLEFNDQNYGYIHLDIVEIDSDGDVLPVDNVNPNDSASMVPNATSTLLNGNAISGIIRQNSDLGKDINGKNRSTTGKGYENPTQSPDSGTEDARIAFLANIFANKLSKETNLKLIKRNTMLKHAIYNGLAIKKLRSNQKIRIVYLPPSEVVYINRGKSIFDNVLFFCKIYIATLITILMQNVLNGGEKRAIYVEVGEDNNGAQVVNQVVKDIKSREVSNIIGMDVQSILNIQSNFQDYYIPVVDGEKPISFETLDSLSNKSIDDDFLKWLGDQIFSGIGTPTAFLNEVDNIDFAKMLSMQNSRYLREVLSEQKILSEGLTELARKLYAVEYGDIVRKGDISAFKLEDIDASLPTPAALALNSVNDQISSSESILNTLIESSDYFTRAGIDEDDSKAMNTLKGLIKSRLMKTFVPSMDWPLVDEAVNASIKDYVEYKLRNDSNSNENGDENDGYGGNDYGNSSSNTDYDSDGGDESDNSNNDDSDDGGDDNGSSKSSSNEKIDVDKPDESQFEAPKI